MFAALLFVHFRTSVRAWIAGTILVGYWVWIAFIPVPGAEAGPFTLEGNWVGYVDRLLLPGRLHQGFFDPEGLLSTLPGIVTAMLGMFTGEFIKLRKEGLTDKRKVAGLVLAGVLLLLVGVVEFGVPDQQKAVEQFVCLRCRSLFGLDVRPVLLHCRCVGMAEMDFLLPGDRG